MRPVCLVALALALTACGGGRERGSAVLWVTRDRGARVLFTGTVPAGLTAMQALVRKQKVSTRYGGRYVQAIDGVSGSLSNQRDWFFFVNGIESSTGAAEVRLRPGDVEWWDYRSWSGGAMSIPVVVGAFPEPFLHGFQWAKPGAKVTGGGDPLRARLQRLVGAGPNEIDVETSAPPNEARADRRGGIVRLVLGVAAAKRLAADPGALRFRFQVSG